MYKLLLVLLFVQMPPSEPPAHLREAFNIVNAGRVQVGLPPLAWDDRLQRAAQEVVDRNWDLYLQGSEECENSHWDLRGRLERAGWFYSGNTPAGGRRGLGNASEGAMGGSSCARGDDGKIYPRTAEGWYHPYRDVNRYTREFVDYLTSGNGSPHQVDFRAYSRVGIGYKGGMLNFVYGVE